MVFGLWPQGKVVMEVVGRGVNAVRRMAGKSMGCQVEVCKRGGGPVVVFWWRGEEEEKKKKRRKKEKWARLNAQ